MAGKMMEKIPYNEVLKGDTILLVTANYASEKVVVSNLVNGSVQVENSMGWMDLSNRLIAIYLVNRPEPDPVNGDEFSTIGGSLDATYFFHDGWLYRDANNCSIGSNGTVRAFLWREHKNDFVKVSS